MRLILHQAMKDVRAQRWLVAAWAAALLAICAIEGLKLDVFFTTPDAAGRGRTLVYMLVALGATRAVLGWLLAVRIVHADPLDGTSAFWLTRPLSPRMLLAAKLGLIGTLLVLVPGAGALVVFVLNGVPASAIPAAVAGWIVSDMLILMVMTLLATMTRDLARIVLALMTGLAAWFALQVVTPLLQLASMFEELQNTGAMSAAWFLLATTLVAACLLLIGRQYLTRRTVQTATAAAVVALVLITTGSLLTAWLRPDGRTRVPAMDHPWSGASGVSLEIPVESFSTSSWAHMIGPSTREYHDSLRASLDIDGAGEGRTIDVVSGHGAWRRSSTGETFTTKNIDWGFGLLDNRMSLQVVERTVGARLLYRPAWRTYLRLLELPSDVYEQHQGVPGVYDADFVLQAYRVWIGAVIPLRSGAAGSVLSQTTTILAIRPGPKQWAVDIRESMPRALSPEHVVRTTHLLRNRKRGEALLLPRYGLLQMSGGGLASSYLTVTRSTLTQSLKGKPATLDPSWFDDAELVLIGFVREGGAFAKHVTIPCFTLPAIDRKGR